MKKYLIIFFALIMIQRIALAVPVIENVSVSPQALWIGESPVISLSCYDNESKTITSVYSNTIGPGIILPVLNFAGYGYFVGDYSSFKPYLDRAGVYNVVVFCNNSDNQSASFSTNFTVSKLTGYISSINSNPAYIGDGIEIDFIAKKDDVALTSGVSFNVTLNDQSYPLKIPPAYDVVKGWILKIDTPPIGGFYDTKIYASYDRTSVYNRTTVEVRNNIQFDIESLSENWMNGNDNITLTLKAKDKGSVIDVNTNDLNVQIASQNLAISDIEKNGDLYIVDVTVPLLSAGTYDLRAILSYNGALYSYSSSVSYVVTLSGRLTTVTGTGSGTPMSFISNGVEKLKIYADNAGYYSGSLPPGTYDISIDLPQSNLYLKNVVINSFDDPIKYFYSADDIVPGIRSAGLFSYAASLNYQEADMEMNYNDKNVLDETDLIVLECSVWNSGRNMCNSGWTDIEGGIDTVRNVVSVNLSSLSTFVIGERKEINTDFNLDSQNYYIGSTIKVSGITKDTDGGTVTNASVKAYIKGIGTSVSTFSDNNGVFSLELKAPLNEGNYTLSLSVNKTPYTSFSDDRNFAVLKSRDIEIVVPETIKLKQGQNFSQEVSIANTGQADLSNLNISLTGIPNNYFNITKSIGKLNENEEDKIYIQFSIPEDAEKNTYSVNITVYNDQIRQEKIFGFTVLGENDTVEQPLPSSPSGNLILPVINLSNLSPNIIYIIIFAVICFSAAILLKKRKIKATSRDDIRGFLFDVKNSLKNVKVETASKSENNYKDLILKEFPNSINKDEYGKNN